MAEASSGRGLVVLFTVASFVGSTLLFLVQPLVAKLLTPLLGGTPDVWNTAMVFFQATLLLGYGIAHLGARWLRGRQIPIHVVLVAIPLLALPLAVPEGWRLPIGTAPALWTLLVLAITVGLPFLALSTASPTFQRWFSLSGHRHAADPVLPLRRRQRGQPPRPAGVPAAPRAPSVDLGPEPAVEHGLPGLRAPHRHLRLGDPAAGPGPPPAP